MVRWDPGTSKPGVHNSNLWSGPKNFRHIKGPKLMYFCTFKMCFYERNNLNKENFEIAGRNKSFSGPLVACGPYVVLAWSRSSIEAICPSRRFKYSFRSYFFVPLERERDEVLSAKRQKGLNCDSRLIRFQGLPWGRWWLAIFSLRWQSKQIF